MLEGLLVVAVVLNTLILVGVIIIAIKLRNVAKSAESLLNQVAQQAPAVLKAAERTLDSVNSLSSTIEDQAKIVSKVLHSADRLFSGCTVVDVATKAVKGGHSTFLGVMAGVKEAIKTLRKPTDERKGGIDK